MELFSLLQKLKINIPLIGELQLHPSHTLKFQKYNIYRADNIPRRASGAHGGTAVLDHRKVVHKQVSLNTQLYSMSIEISLGDRLVLVS